MPQPDLSRDRIWRHNDLSPPVGISLKHAAVRHVPDDFLLRAAKGRQAEYGVEEGEWIAG